MIDQHVYNQRSPLLHPSGSYPLLPQQQVPHPLTMMAMMMMGTPSFRLDLDPERSSCSSLTALGAVIPSHNDLTTKNRPRYKVLLLLRAGTFRTAHWGRPAPGCFPLSFLLFRVYSGSCLHS